MASDALVSLGVVLAGIAILTTGWLWFDPVLSLMIAVFVTVGTWPLFKDAIRLSLDAVPAGINPLVVRGYLAELPGVTRIRNLHIWGISTQETALTAHLVIPQGYTGDRFLVQTRKELRDKFGIGHVTLQIEAGDMKYPSNLEAEYKF